MDAFLQEYGNADFNALLEAAAPLRSRTPPPDDHHDDDEEDDAHDHHDDDDDEAADGPMATPANAVDPRARLAEMRQQKRSSEETQPQLQQKAKAKVVRAGVDLQVSQSREEQEAAAAALRLYRAAEQALRGAAAEDAALNAQNSAAAHICYTVAEARGAREHEVKWRNRGPRGENAPSVWRGQRWREGSARYSSRGGARQAEFAALFRKKGKGKDGCKDQGKGGSSDQGKGRSSENGKGGGSEKGKGGSADKGKGRSSEKGKEKGRAGKSCISHVIKLCFFIV